MSIITVLLVIAAATLLATDVQAQNNGDIRLVTNDNDDDDIDIDGRLEVFINRKWGTVCGNGSTDLQAVAYTACRQLGFKEIVLFGTVTQLDFPVASKSTPIHFGSMDCGSSASDGDCSIDYHQHVLRCAISTEVNTTACTHSNDIAISCFDNIASHPYESQVALSLVGDQHHPRNLSRSSGGLVIFLDNSNKPGAMCGINFDKNAADTACRQLGYTNANYFNTSLQTTKQTLVWDAGLNCKSKSHSCLNNCFSKTPNNQTSCTTNLVYLSCEFDVSRKGSESAGSPRQCDATVDNNCGTHFEGYTVSVPTIIVVVVILAIIAACTTCIVLLVCCLVPGCLIHRKRSGYQPVS